MRPPISRSTSSRRSCKRSWLVSFLLSCIGGIIHSLGIAIHLWHFPNKFYSLPNFEAALWSHRLYSSYFCLALQCSYIHRQNRRVDRVPGDRTRAVVQNSRVALFLRPEASLAPYHGRHTDGTQFLYDLVYGRKWRKSHISFLSIIISSNACLVLQKEQARKDPLGRHAPGKAKWWATTASIAAGYRIYRPYRNGRPKRTINDGRDIVIDEGCNFAIYTDPDLPPIDPTAITTAYKAPGWLKMGQRNARSMIAALFTMLGCPSQH